MNIQSNDPSGRSASLAAWYDGSYRKLDSVRNRYSLDLDNLHKKVHELWSQSPESATKLGPLKTRIENFSKMLEVSRAEFDGWSRDRIGIFFKRLEDIRRLIIHSKGVASRQQMQQRQPPGSQPQLIADSPQPSLQSTSQLHPLNRKSPLSKAGTPLQNVSSDPNVSSTSSPLSASSSSLNSLKNVSISPLSAVGTVNRPQGLFKEDQILSQTTNKDQASSTGSPKKEEVTLPEENPAGDSHESSLERLLDVVKSISDEALCAALQDIDSISNDGLQGPSSETNYLESTAACRTKMPEFQLNTAVLDEIKEINNRLVETALDLVSDSTKSGSNAGFGEGTFIIRCSYSPVGLRRNRELPLFCAQLLVPSDYPSSSPLLLSDSFSSLSEAVEEECDLAKKVNRRFSSSLGKLPQPPSLKEMARKWDDCARSVFTEFAVSTGGGSFSTKYGKWDNCI